MGAAVKVANPPQSRQSRDRSRRISPVAAHSGDRLLFCYIFFAANQAGPRSNHAAPLAEQGYTETEYFFSGSAHAYAASSALATAAVVAGPYPYMTRMVVREPANKRQFNGVVLVEWYNVTNGFDAENLWFYDWEHILGQHAASRSAVNQAAHPSHGSEGLGLS